MIKKVIKNGSKLTAFHANHLLKKYDSTLWLVGDGRSGTTWISDLVNNDQYFREMFEPFHPHFIKKMQFLSPHQYVRPHENNARLFNTASKVFTGSLWDARTDMHNKIGLYNGLMVKDIFAHLFCNWAYHHFPNIKITLLVRNPFAVALSKYRKKNWKWVDDPMALYNQTSLMEDYLQPYEHLIKQTCDENDYILKQILIWSIIHYVTFHQFQSNQIHVMFYENVFLNPTKEIASLYQFIGKKFNGLSDRTVQQPSRVAGDNIKKGKSPIDAWLNELPSDTIDKGFSILEAFGLEGLYTSTSIPNKFNLDDYQTLAK